MATVIEAKRGSLDRSRGRRMADVLASLGSIPADRVLLDPAPGTATEADAVRLTESGVLCELVNGTLVEKAMSMPESFLGTILATFFNMYVFPRSSGAVVTGDAQFRMLHGNVRMPDVSFTLRSRMPNPLPQVGGWCPDLCVEVLSPSNTKKEMTIKRGECFQSGCRLFWIIDRKKRIADVYRLDGTSKTLSIADSFDGEDVLPGFTLPLAELFGKYDELSTPE